jgi:toxin YoeB
VIWSFNAQNDRKEILQYWKQRNKSTAYSKKLRKLFSIAIKQIKLHPGIGSPTQLEGVRVKVVRDYLIVYKEFDNELHLLAIWDSRRNRELMKRRLQS